MPPTTSFPRTTQIQDPATRAAVQDLYKLVQQLQGQITTLQAAAIQPGTTTVAMANGSTARRVTGVANPQAGDDAVNLVTLQLLIENVKSLIP